MKYNTLFVVPVVALATLANALPSDASVNAKGYPSDQGKYKHQDKAPKQKQDPQGPLNGVPILGQAKLPQAPIDVSAAKKLAPVNVETVENTLPINPLSVAKKLPVDPLATENKLAANPVGAVNIANIEKTVPINAVENALPLGTVEKVLPINPESEAKSLPVAGVVASVEKVVAGAKPGFLPALPVDLPPKVPSVRRSRTHAIRATSVKSTCGRLIVAASDPKYSGFVASQRDEDGRYLVTRDSSKAVLVDLNGHDLIFRNMDLYPALGATFGVMEDKNAGHNNVQGNSANFAMLTGTSMTQFGKSASLGTSSFNDETGANQWIESAVFYFGENQEIHASWINTDGHSIPLEFGVNPDKEVIMSANVGQYAASYGGNSARLFCRNQ